MRFIDRSPNGAGFRFYTPTKLSENIRETPEGFLVCLNVPVTRTGELIYIDGEVPIEAGEDGKIIITREEEDVFQPETMASFEGKAVTIEHPNDFVSPTNWQSLARGTIQNVRRGEGEDADKLLADLLITDSIAIGLVKNGLREVSLGYEAQYVQTGKGRGRQRNIRGNHCALVDKGRAGSTCAINDHKGEETFMGKMAKLKAKLTKVFDEMSDEENKSKKKSEDQKALDEMKQKYADMGKEIAAKEEALKAGDEDESDKGAKGGKKKDESQDEEVNSGLEDRLKSLEDKVNKIIEAIGEGEESEEELAEEEGMDEDSEEDETDDEDAEEESVSTGDSAPDAETVSRAEIIAPGIDKKQKDLESDAKSPA